MVYRVIFIEMNITGCKSDMELCYWSIIYLAAQKDLLYAMNLMTASSVNKIYNPF